MRLISHSMLVAGVAVATMSAAHASQPLPSPFLVAQTSPQAAVPAVTKPRQLSLEHRPFTGDFDAMVERRLIRVLVPHSRTLYYNDKGRERGLTAELVRDLERYSNQKSQQLGSVRSRWICSDDARQVLRCWCGRVAISRGKSRY